MMLFYCVAHHLGAAHYGAKSGIYIWQTNKTLKQSLAFGWIFLGVCVGLYLGDRHAIPKGNERGEYLASWRNKHIFN